MKTLNKKSRKTLCFDWTTTLYNIFIKYFLRENTIKNDIIITLLPHMRLYNRNT